MNRWHLTAALATALTTGTGKTVSISKAPVLTGTQVLSDLFPYGVLYALGPIEYPLDAYDGTFPVAQLSYQVSSVGGNEQQADWMAAKVRGLLLNPATVITSSLMQSDPLRVIRVEPGPTDGAEESAEGLVSISERFAITVTER